MPELPEVETIARGLQDQVRGDRIDAVWFSEKPEPFKSSPQAMAAALQGKRIDQVARIGKHIVFDLSAPPWKGGRRQNSRSPDSLQWIVHLGMTGRLLICDPALAQPPHTHAVLGLASGRELRFIDPRRFGRLGLHGNPEAGGVDRGFQGTGQEPLSISPEEFVALFRKRRVAIKSALLNQNLLQGVGNIYADESLFQAGIGPRRLAARLSRRRLELLLVSLRSVLTQAIALGGSSVSDYVDASGKPGFFQLEHKVYARTGQPCRVCGTPIRRIVVAGRGTHYCPRCQK